LLKKAISSLKDLKIKFIEREQPSKEVVDEMNEFLNEQFIDIYFQSFKMANWYNKPFMMLMILANLDIFISNRGWQYFRTKLAFLPTRKEKI